MQFALFLASVLLQLIILLYLPETAQPRSRGIDKLLETEAIDAIGDDDTAVETEAMDTLADDGTVVKRSEAREGRGWRWVWLNPLESIAMFRSPALLTVVSCIDDRYLALLVGLVELIGIAVIRVALVSRGHGCTDDGLW